MSESQGLKVSIITVMLNPKDFIVDAIESVLSQSYSNIQYIVVDGASKDGSLDVIKSYGNKIHRFISEPDKGIYDAMNKGLALATGDIIGFLHSDDFYAHSDVITAIVTQFSNEATDAVYGDLDYVKLTDKTKIVRKWRSGNYNEKRFYYGWMPPHPTFFARKKVYAEFGGYNTTLKSAADYELMLRMGLVHKLQLDYLPQVLVKMRLGGQSNRSFKNRILANLEDQKAWKVNKIKPYWFTFLLKPLQKITQYF